MRKDYSYKNEGAEEREKKHQFGQPEGNKRGNPSVAVSQREFYRWCETIATEDELRAYVRDASKPMARRKFVASLMQCDRVQDFFDLTNQTHGQPKQVVEVQELPVINCSIFGDE